MSGAEPRVLVTGFGPFLEVRDNPAARAARAVDGALIPWGAGEARVVGRIIPVSYARGPAATMGLARRWRAHAIVGLGVARGRAQIAVERLGRRAPLSDSADVDGVRLDDLEPGGPEIVAATGAVDALARALGALVSEDAGGYVCNAWLYRVTRACERLASPLQPSVVFVHVPDQGVESERLIGALPTLWRETSIAAATTRRRRPSASTS